MDYEGNQKECTFQVFSIGAEDGEYHEFDYDMKVPFIVKEKHLSKEYIYSED